MAYGMGLRIWKCGSPCRFSNPDISGGFKEVADEAGEELSKPVRQVRNDR